MAEVAVRTEGAFLTVCAKSELPLTISSSFQCMSSCYSLEHAQEHGEADHVAASLLEPFFVCC